MAEKPGKSHLEFSRCSIQDIQTNFNDPEAKNCLRKPHDLNDDDFTLCEYYNVAEKKCYSLARIILIFGLIVPWSFILLITFVLMIGLCYDLKYFNICNFFKNSQNPCRLSA